ncbi:virulence factor TspB C-terminal domain-related protein [Chitinimonas koreensis]|uniref:virulence factor TspB C-terminal domain-related protein n=1 Tax=Chitinimonas koreensis TaxID=356302 RepID=UPI0012FC528A|nr:virulence factor TspB C-terminal domain-related protein [Chitinimonas koreensis]QNM98683.1 hypothetical protein H9L41_10935 [Chitinimonas koreensis]
MTLDDLKANGNRGCIGGCLVSISGANMAYQSINGTISKGVFGAGTATNTGAKCEGGSNSIGDKNPADGDMTYPQSQADCGANQKFTYVQGHGYCAHADAENPNQTEYCKQHQYEATCSEGGEEFCKANTKAYACIPGSERYCSLKPNSPSCAPGNADFCRQNPDHPSCVPGQPEYCSTHPDDSQCREKDVQDCVANPSLPKCTQVEHCSVNPSDPTCSAPTTAYCTQFKDDLKCKGSQFGGSCSAGFSCTGDAIQCAIAKQQHETICALTPSGADPIVQAGEKALAGQDPGMQYLPGGSKQGETMDFGFTMSGASATPLFGTASAECPAPRRVDLDIMGYQRSIEIPWIAVCRYAELVGPFVLIVATMIASFIAFGKR